MKQILVIDQSQIFRDYLKEKLESYDFAVSAAGTGIEGLSKMRSLTPDLVILDFHLARMSALDLLKEKAHDPNVANIPVILASSSVDRSVLVSVSQYNVRKMLSKPVRVDALIKAVSDVLMVEIPLDQTPSIIEANVNDDVILIEVAQGLNTEKIDLLRYKLLELLDLYKITTPRVLLMVSNITIGVGDVQKLELLFRAVFQATGVMRRYLKVLTANRDIAEFLHNRNEFSGVEMVDSLVEAMSGLSSRVNDSDDEFPETSTSLRERLVQRTAPRKAKDETIMMRFHDDTFGSSSGVHQQSTPFPAQLTVAVVDDDPVIHELVRICFDPSRVSVQTYSDGSSFLADDVGLSADIVFLDLVMPRMNGVEVLRELRKRELAVPVVIMSALTKRETVIGAMKLGVKSYMIKPLKPQAIRMKVAEVLQRNF